MCQLSSASTSYCNSIATLQQSYCLNKYLSLSDAVANYNTIYLYSYLPSIALSNSIYECISLHKMTDSQL